MVNMNKLPGEGTIAPPTGLSPEEETFLFGDQGPLNIASDIDAIFHKKRDLAYAWLAQFWALPVPDDFIETEATAYAAAQEENAKMRALDPDNDKAGGFLPDSTGRPVYWALQLEWRGQSGPLHQRPILQTVLIDAYNALNSDPARDEKLRYVLALAEEEYEISWARGYRKYEFPQPLPAYTEQAFPTHLAETDLLL